MKEIRRILVVRTDRIGDVILTLPVITALRRKFTNAHIAMLIRHYTTDIVQENPDINEIIFDDDGTREISLMQQVRNIRAKQFDVVVVAKPSWRLALMFFCAGIPVRIGTGYRLYSFLFNKKINEHRRFGERHEAEYNLRLLQPLGFIPTEKIYPKLVANKNNIDDIKMMLLKYNIQATEMFIILHPGSGGSSKNWSASKFAALGKIIAENYSLKIIVTGSKNEAALVQNVVAFIGENAVQLQEQLSLQQFIALVSLAKLFIANSTGPLHIAAALGVHVVGLFPQHPSMGSTRWGPCTEKKYLFSPENKPADCSKCNSHAHCDCMDSISVDDVLNKIQHILISI